MTFTTVKPKNPTSQESRKSSPAKGESSGTEKPFDLVDYFKGVRQEWDKITWPGRPQVIAETGIVVVIVTLFSLLIFAVDKLFQLIIQWIT